MRVLTCPRCRTNVQVAPGAVPVCTACGFGGPNVPVRAAAPAAAAPRPPSSGSARPPYVGSGGYGVPPARAAPKRRTGLVVSVSVVAVLLVAGGVLGALYAFGPLGGKDEVGTLSQEQAEQRALSAVAALAGDLSEEGGDLVRMSGTMTVSDDDMGPGEMTFEFEFGTGGSSRASIDMDAEGFAMQGEMVCTPDAVYVVWAGMVLVTRPDEEGCGMPTGEDPEDEMDPFGGLFEDGTAAGVDVGTVTQEDDGSLTAVLTDEDGTYTVTVDKQGRIVSMEIDATDGTGRMDFEYGTRRAIEVPSGGQRLPVDAEFEETPTATGLSAEVWFVDEYVPLSEVELHVRDGDTVVARFPLDRASTTDGGLTLRFTDGGEMAGDLDEGDTLTIQGEWDPAWEIVVYDEWAQEYDGGVEMPGPSLLAVVGLLGAAAFVLRRRR